MRPPIFLASSTLAALALVGCAKNTTYNFPTASTPLIQRSAAPEEIEEFQSSYLDYVTFCANNLHNTEADFVFPALSSYQSGLTLLAGSETTTYAEIAHYLHTTAPDEYAIVQGFNHLIYPLRNIRPASLKFGTSLWTVWPLQVDKAFQFDSAERIGSDIVRLGSTGITAQRAFTRWFKQFQPELDLPPPPLSRETPIMNVGATTYTGNFELTSVKLKDNNVILHGSSAGFVFLAWQPTPGQFLLTEETIQAVRNSPPIPASSPSSVSVNQTSSVDLVPLAESAGVKKLLVGPNDLKNLSIDIIPAGDEIGIPFMIQHAAVNIKLTGADPFDNSNSTAYAVLDGRTNLPLLIGFYSKK